jgi:hypothetical protein
MILNKVMIETTQLYSNNSVHIPQDNQLCPLFFEKGNIKIKNKGRP